MLGLEMAEPTDQRVTGKEHWFRTRALPVARAVVVRVKRVRVLVYILECGG